MAQLFEKSDTTEEAKADDDSSVVVRSFRQTFRMRQQSEHHISFVSLIQYQKLSRALQLERLHGRSEVLQVRALIQQLMSQLTKTNYYSVILKDIRKLAEFFLDQSLSNLMEIRAIKEMGHKLSQLKNDFQRKQQLATLSVSPDSPSVPPSEQTYSLSKTEIDTLKYIFSVMQFMLSRFKRI